MGGAGRGQAQVFAAWAPAVPRPACLGLGFPRALSCGGLRRGGVFGLTPGYSGEEEWGRGGCSRLLPPACFCSCTVRAAACGAGAASPHVLTKGVPTCTRRRAGGPHLGRCVRARHDAGCVILDDDVIQQHSQLLRQGCNELTRSKPVWVQTEGCTSPPPPRLRCRPPQGSSLGALCAPPLRRARALGHLSRPSRPHARGASSRKGFCPSCTTHPPLLSHSPAALLPRANSTLMAPPTACQGRRWA